MKTTENKTISTQNRKLENYFYLCGIKPIAVKNLWDGMVEWVYFDTPALRQAHMQYKNIVQRRASE